MTDINEEKLFFSTLRKKKQETGSFVGIKCFRSTYSFLPHPKLAVKEALHLF